MIILDKVLLQLEEEINYIPVPDPMPDDKWLVSSAMQKCIRRGLEEPAMRAAVSLWHYDRQNFWTRLHICSVEDVRITAIDTIAKVMVATASATWRRRKGDLQVGLHLVQLLCRAVKIRTADKLLIQAERSPQLIELRARLADSTDETLIAIASDESGILVERCLALWYLAGTKVYHRPNAAADRFAGKSRVSIAVIECADCPYGSVHRCGRSDAVAIGSLHAPDMAGNTKVPPAAHRLPSPRSRLCGWPAAIRRRHLYSYRKGLLQRS